MVAALENPVLTCFTMVKMVTQLTDNSCTGIVVHVLDQTTCTISLLTMPQEVIDGKLRL